MKLLCLIISVGNVLDLWWGQVVFIMEMSVLGVSQTPSGVSFA